LRFWDSSALVPLVVEEESSSTVEKVLREDPEIITWWATRVECASAVARKARMLGTGDKRPTVASQRLEDLADHWTEVAPAERLRELALRLLRVHDLRAADALQLAAALIASEDRPETLELVTLDDRLGDAARREGFRVVSV
jgi:uncharacterized protein